MAKNFYVVTGSAAVADTVAVGAASAEFPNINTMAAGQYFVFCSSVACWIKQGTNPVASAAAGSMFVPANVQVMIDGALGTELAVIQASTGGTASLVRVKAE